MLYDLLLIVLLVQFAIGVFLYSDARRLAKRAIVDFISRANDLEARFEAQFDALGIAIDHVRKQERGAI